MKQFIVGAGCLAALVAGRMMADDKAGDPAKGKEVFEQCAVCHNTDTDEKKIGPSLKGLFKRAKLKNGKPVNDANVLQVVNAGGGGMPSYSDTLSDEEKTNVLAYLKTL
jgi:cytochrome c